MAQSTWEGATSNDWGTGSNWNPAGVPADGSDVVIADSTGSSSRLILNGDREVGSWLFGDSGTRNSGFTVRTVDDTLKVNGGLTAGELTGVRLSYFGNVTITQDQEWSIGGQVGAHNSDKGVFIREVTNSGGTRTGVSSLVLDGNLSKSDTGQLVIAATTVSGAGNFIVNDGALKLNAGASSRLTVGGTGNITLSSIGQLFVARNSGTMDITRDIILNDTSGMVWGGGGTSNDSTIASDIAWNGSAHTLNMASNNRYESTGAWTGSATVNRTGTRTLTLSGDNSGFTGTLNLGGGTNHINSSLGGTLNVDGGTANLNGPLTGDLNINGGTANLSSSVAGNLTLAFGAAVTGEVVVGGGLDLDEGTFSIDPTTAASFGATGALTLTGTNEVTLSANPISSAPFTVLSYGGILTGGVANLDLVGGAANYRSPTFNDATPGIITLAVGSESRTWTGGDGDWDINTTANWVEGDQLFYQLDDVTFGETGAAIISLIDMVSPSTITVDSSTDYEFLSSFATDLIAGSGSLTKDGAGTLTIGGTNTFNGGIQIAGGLIKPVGNQALGGNGQVITIASGAALDANGVMSANRDYHAVISGTGVGGTGAIVNTGAGKNNGFVSITLAADASIGGTGRFDVRPITAGTAFIDLASFTLRKSGSNLVSLVDGTWSAAGAVEIDEGTLAITRMNVSGIGSINVNSGATLQLENNNTGTTITKEISIDNGTLRNIGANFTLDSAITVSNTASFQMDSFTMVLSNNITGGGLLNKTGTTTLTLAGDATHSGGTIVASGRLQVGNNGTSGSITGDITNNGTLRFKRSDAHHYGGIVSGSGTFDKEGDGMLTVSGVSTYTGLTSIDSGTLKLDGGNNRLPTSNQLLIANTVDASFDLNGFNQEFRTLNGGGSTGGRVISSGGITSVVTMRPSGGDSVTFSGRIDGDVRVEISGSKSEPSGGTPRQRFAGTASSYTGGVLVDGATLLLRGDGSLGTVPASFEADNITLRNNGTILNNEQALTIDANRGITIGSGGGGLVAGWGKTFTCHGAISGAPGNTLTIVPNNGTIVLTGNSSYAGDTILGAGSTARLRVGDGGTSGTLGTGNVSNDGQLTFDRSDASSYSGVISGTGTVTKLGAGTLTLDGANTYTGNTMVSEGVLSISQPYLANTSKITIETDAIMNLTFAGNNVIDSLVLGGVTMGTGTYNATTDPTFFTGTGSLLVGTDYDLWVDGFGLTGTDALPTSDPDKDGVNNDNEYTFGLDPTDPSSLSATVGGIDPGTGTYTYTRRDPSLTGLSYAIYTSTDLVVWDLDAGATAGQSPSVPDVNDVETVTVTLTATAVEGKLFSRVVATP